MFDASEAGALATLIDEPSPFGKSGRALDSEIFLWLDRVVVREPDIILLDFHARLPIRDLHKQGAIYRNVFQNIQHNSLLIAGGGYEERGPKTGIGGKRAETMVTVPSAYREVLSVGSLGDDGRLRKHAEWRRRIAKPDLFMTDNLAVTPLAIALKSEVLERMTENPTWGGGFAALHAVATAALVWSLLPDLPPDDIRELLVEAGQPIPGTKAARALTMESAINLARQRLVEQTLREGAASLQTLSAITGLEGRVLTDILLKDERVVRLSTGRLERFQLLESEE